MDKKRRVAVSAGAVMAAGLMAVAVWKGQKRLQNWSKGKIETLYLKTRNQDDVAWG